MNGTALLVLLLFVSVPGPQAGGRDAGRECREVRQQIARIHAEMRAGYRAKAGNRLAERLRKLKKRRARVCR